MMMCWCIVLFCQRAQYMRFISFVLDITIRRANCKQARYFIYRWNHMPAGTKVRSCTVLCLPTHFLVGLYIDVELVCCNWTCALIMLQLLVWICSLLVSGYSQVPVFLNMWLCTVTCPAEWNLLIVTCVGSWHAAMCSIWAGNISNLMLTSFVPFLVHCFVFVGSSELWIMLWSCILCCTSVLLSFVPYVPWLHCPFNCVS